MCHVFVSWRVDCNCPKLLFSTNSSDVQQRCVQWRNTLASKVSIHSQLESTHIILIRKHRFKYRVPHLYDYINELCSSRKILCKTLLHIILWQSENSYLLNVTYNIMTHSCWSNYKMKQTTFKTSLNKTIRPALTHLQATSVLSHTFIYGLEHSGKI